MTKAELLETLEDVPDDAEVFVCNQDAPIDSDLLLEIHDSGVHEGEHVLYVRNR